MHSLRKAPREVGDLLNELKDFLAQLEETEKFVKQNNYAQSSARLKSLVVRGGKAVNNINTLLALPTFPFLKLSDDNRAKVVCLTGSRKLKALQTSLGTVRLEFLTLLGILAV